MMLINHHLDNQVVIFNFAGDLDWEGVAQAGKYIMPFLDDTTDFKGVAFDLEQVPVIDSSGIGLLIEIFKSLQAVQSRGALWGLTQKKLQQFQMMKLDQVIPIYSSREEALNAILRPRSS